MSTLAEKRAVLSRFWVNVRFASVVKKWLPDVEFVKNCGNPVVWIAPLEIGDTWRDPS